ncbi:transcription initiation factor-like protein iib [Ophiobolus disseminans]|uniref:Transcription initiation factor IIB n=1 Tax=Ophiobolus disseminans TaxID=1469910 RepID=A0A6A7A7E0_9PLEO|nr:transcription initiation factor-like protein iib [Ophiobolus disseminans]
MGDAVERAIAAELYARLRIPLTCPDCDDGSGSNIIEDISRGETKCGDCGRILCDGLLDEGQEWRTFANDDQCNADPSRVGAAPNLLLHGSQLETEIKFADTTYRSSQLSRAYQNDTARTVNSKLKHAFYEIDTLCKSQHLSRPVAETAQLIFRRQADAKTFANKTQDVIIAGCLYLACKSNGVTRSLSEIHKVTMVSKKQISLVTKALQKLLDADTSAHNNNAVFTTSGSATPYDLIGRICTKLGLCLRIQCAAERLAELCAEDSPLEGRSPLSAAGAIVYEAARRGSSEKSLKEVAAAAGVGLATLRNVHKLFGAYMEKSGKLDSVEGARQGL